MEQTLADFVLEWNKVNKRFTFVVEMSVLNRPTSVEVRYPAAKYQEFYSTDIWCRLNDMVEEKSHGTMYVVTNEHLFERGIIEIKIASQNHNYQSRLVIGVLTWLGKEFFPNK